MSNVTKLHDATKRGDLGTIKMLLDENRDLANSRSETDARGTYPLHVAAEFGQADAARVLVDYGADVSLLDSENEAIALGWAAFFGRPEVVAVCSKPAPSQVNAIRTASLHSGVQGVEQKVNGKSSPMRRWKTGKGRWTSSARTAEWSEVPV